MSDEQTEGGWTYQSESCYGAFPEGHDPRAFVPDFQMCSRAELKATCLRRRLGIGG